MAIAVVWVQVPSSALFFCPDILWTAGGCGGTVDALDSGSSESNLV